ncbi:MAG: hypothetical protein IPK82_05970 [Polyangiaceae bacterium]|nr:hypothetical protein [Polyangiaceae bacterium]
MACAESSRTRQSTIILPITTTYPSTHTALVTHHAGLPPAPSEHASLRARASEPGLGGQEARRREAPSTRPVVGRNTVATVRNTLDTVQCEVALLSSKIRKSAALNGNAYAEAAGGQDGRFSIDPTAVEALSTTTADDDAGMFQLDLRDEKLLPYEGRGVLSTWRVEVPADQNRFALHRIADVVLHVRYTSRDAGDLLKSKAKTHLNGSTLQRVRVISAKTVAHEAFASFGKGQDNPPPAHRLEIPVTREGFHTFLGKRNVQIVKVTVSATFNEKYTSLGVSSPTHLTFKLTPPGQAAITGALQFLAGEPHTDLTLAGDVPVKNPDEGPFVPWVFSIEDKDTDIPSHLKANGKLHPDALEDIWLTFTYEEAP